MRMRRPPGIWVVLVLATYALPAFAFNSEEHKFLVDQAIAGIVLPAGIVFESPTGFEERTDLEHWHRFTDAKDFAVGFHKNIDHYESTFCFFGNDPDYPPQFDPYKKGIQDTSYWNSYVQIAGNFNIWIPPLSHTEPRALYVAAHLNSNASKFTLGDLVAIYGDYRRTSHCVGGNCYLTQADLTTMTFPFGRDCYLFDCGYRPSPMRADDYLRRIAAGLWPPYICGGETDSSGIVREDAGWWGDEMLRIASVNDWHFGNAAVAWYIGLHRLALLAVDEARTDASYWNKALHYEANALHSLTDLFCFGHIVTNRDWTSLAIINDSELTATGDSSYAWMNNVIAMGGGILGMVDLGPALPNVLDKRNPRNDFMRPTREPLQLLHTLNEKSMHDAFNKDGATVRNLLGERFEIHGDGMVRRYFSDVDPALEHNLEPIRAAIRESVESLFQAYERLQSGESVEQIASAGSTYFLALKRLPVFVETDLQNHFSGQWTRYAGDISVVSGSNLVPDNWTQCVMPYQNGATSLPEPHLPCTSFPDPTPVFVQVFLARPGAHGVEIQWLLAEASEESEFLLRASGAGHTWTVQHTRVDARRFAAIDDSPEVALAGLVQYELAHRVPGSIWTVVGETQIRIENLPTVPQLLAPVPNPFNPRATLEFVVGDYGRASLAIYRLDGRKVAQLADGYRAPGRHVVVWDGTDDQGHPVSSGIYVALLDAHGVEVSQKLALIR